MERPHFRTMPLKTANTRWREVVLVCRKCQKKLDGGFGPDGDQSLKKALKRYLKPEMKVGKGRKAELAVIETGCFDICPKGAVVAVNAARPDAVLIVPPGIDLLELRQKLGVTDRRRATEAFEIVAREPVDVAARKA
ncbi:MAG: hypothetical protein ACK4Z5_01335 [Brevundimonas sp.]